MGKVSFKLFKFSLPTLGITFSTIFRFYVTKPPKKSCLIISHTQKIFKICFTISVESSITFLNLVLAVLKWAVGRFKNGNRRLYIKFRAKSKYAP